MLQLFYRQESKGTRYLIGRYLFFSLFQSFLPLDDEFPPSKQPPLGQSLCKSPSLHILTLFSSQSSKHFMFALWMFAIQSITCSWTGNKKNAQEEYVVLNGKTELNVLNSEENEIIICQKLASWMFTEKQKKKKLEGFQEINSSSGFFLPKEHTHRKLFTVKFTGLLNQILFLNVPLPTHPCNAPFLSTAQFE